jgi:hypothetical protein
MKCAWRDLHANCSFELPASSFSSCFPLQSSQLKPEVRSWKLGAGS